MANDYAQTMLTRTPDDFRFTEAEAALLRLMGFVVFQTEGERPYAFAGTSGAPLTMSDLALDHDPQSDICTTARAILANAFPTADPSSVANPEFGFADLLQHALRARDHTGFIQTVTSFSCDKGRVDAFGGSALHITADRFEYINTGEWLSLQAARAGDTT